MNAIQPTGYFKDLAGLRFGRLTAVAISGKLNGNYTWLCRCDCGKQISVRGGNLANGHAKSCGCVKGSRKHGMHGTRTYLSWQGMRHRCLNPDDPFFKEYGGRGITICDRWLESFEKFFADMGERPRGKTLDRRDNERGYSPGNCRWATPKEQNRNSRNNRVLTIRGESLCVMEWSERAGIDHRVIYNRLRLGWREQRAVFQSPRPRKRKKRSTPT